MKRACEICGFDRVIDRAHIIPRRILENLFELEHFANFEDNNKNIIFLCKNHHSLFDSWKLNKDEMNKILPKIKQMIPEIQWLMDTREKPINFKVPSLEKTITDIFLEQKVRIMRKWFDRLFKYFNLSKL